MANQELGGRGNKASYQTKLVRIPIPLEQQVEILKQRYYHYVNQGFDPDYPPMWITISSSNEGIDSKDVDGDYQPPLIF